MKRADVDHVEWSLAGLVLGPVAIVLVFISVGSATGLLLIATGLLANIGNATWFAIMMLVTAVVALPNLLIYGQGHLRLFNINHYLTAASAVAIVCANWTLKAPASHYCIALAAPMLAAMLLQTTLVRRVALNVYVARAALRDAQRQQIHQRHHETR